MDAGIDGFILSLKVKNLELKEIEKLTMERYSCSRKTFYNYWTKLKNLSDAEAKKLLQEKGPDKYNYDAK